MLVQAAEAGDFALVYALIAAGVDVNSANEHGTTPLMAAAAQGHLAVVSLLLESGADFKAKRLDAFDALALAVFYGHLDIVRELLARGANPKTNERLGTSIDTWATIRGFHDIAQVLTSGQTIGSTVMHQNELSSVPKALEVQKQPSAVASAYVPKPRYNLKRRSRNLTTRLASIMSGSSRSIESTYIESTYVAKPRYRNKGKFKKLVRWLTYITSDSRRLTGLTLIVMFVCGLGVVAILNLFGSSNLSQADIPVTISEAPAPDNPSLDPQNDLQSITHAQPIGTTSGISDASAEQSVLAEKKSDDRSGPKVNNTEHSSRLPNVEPSPNSSERVDGRHSKAAVTSNQETQRGARSAQSAWVSPKSIPSTNIVVAAGAKGSPNRFAKKPEITKTQRPRRVSGRNDQLVPAATSGRNPKAKVIQWP